MSKPRREFVEAAWRSCRGCVEKLSRLRREVVQATSRTCLGCVEKILRLRRKDVEAALTKCPSHLYSILTQCGRSATKVKRSDTIIRTIELITPCCNDVTKLFNTIYFNTKVFIVDTAMCDLKLKNCFKMRETVNIYIGVGLFLQKNVVLY